MVPSIQNTSSALYAYSKQMNVSATNVANVYSDAFKKSRTVNTEGENGQVKTVITQVDTPGPLVEDPLSETGQLKELSNTDLAEEFSNQMMIEYGFKANAKVIKTYEETIGSLLDMMG